MYEWLYAGLCIRGCASGGGGASGGARITLLEVDTRDHRDERGGPHLGLATAGGGDFGFSERFNTGTLLQRVDGHLEIGVGQDARDGPNGGAGVLQAAGDQLVGGGGGDGGGGGGAREGPDGVGRGNGGVQGGGGAALGDHGTTELAQVPIKAELGVVGLLNFNKAGLERRNMGLQAPIILDSTLHGGYLLHRL